MLEVDRWIKANVRCCSCGGSLKRSRYINIVCLDKLATWEYPTGGNILVRDKYPEPRATAILCDRCIRLRREPKYAIEWDSEHTYIKYHKVEDLKDLPHIPEEEVLRAKAELYDFGM